MAFNREKDKIAITIPNFKLKRGGDSPFQRYSEPYIVSLAIDSHGAVNPSIDFNVMPFPKVATGSQVVPIP